MNVCVDTDCPDYPLLTLFELPRRGQIALDVSTYRLASRKIENPETPLWMTDHISPTSYSDSVGKSPCSAAKSLVDSLAVLDVVAA